MSHTVQWHTANPLWEKVLADTGGRRFHQPAILRFAKDSFMDDLATQLKTDPSGLDGFVARPESWTTPDAGWTDWGSYNPDTPLKLYQPAHGRFYLITASLICRVTGLPDKCVTPACDEKVGFVVRQLFPVDGGKREDIRPSNPATFEEYGWIGGTWTKVGSPASVDDTEDRLPMFPLNYQTEIPRRVLAGFIPVASRETYQGAGKTSSIPTPSEAAGDILADPRVVLFTATVLNPLSDLRTSFSSHPPTDAHAREILAFALLDLSEFLRTYLTQVSQAISGGWAGTSTTQKAVYDKLNVQIVGGETPTYITAIAAVEQKRTEIMAGTVNAGTIAPIASLDHAELLSALNYLAPPGSPPPSDSLRTRVFAALTATAAPANDPGSVPPDVPKLDPQAGSLYVIRCVYDRPRCVGAGKTVVSDPSPAFQLASFFDPDAPTRPIRISMPVDTSMAGLKKFPKGVSVLISKELRQQLARIDGIKMSALDSGDLGDEGGFDLGMICSLSIPIITICALILLMIIISLLNIVFWWLPFFKICFPLKLKAR